MSERLRALVVGGSRGVGRAAALELAGRGYDVAVACRSSLDRAEKVVAELPAGARGLVLQGDIADAGADLVAQAVAGLGGLDAVVVTAVPVITGPLAAAPPVDVARSFDVVVHGFRAVALAALPHLARSGGAVVAVSSLGAHRYAGYYGALGPAKAALESTVRYLAVEFGRSGVRVNAVSPCLIDDPEHFADAPELVRFLETTARRTPLHRRLAEPADVARTVAALLGPDFSCVTGQVVVVDGAYSLQA